MGRYAGVRGWLECEHSEVPQLREAIHAASAAGGPPESAAARYLKGWVFPETGFNWTAYVFYGGDVRCEFVDWLEAQVLAAARSLPDVEGWFRVDVEDGESVWWEVCNGGISVHPVEGGPGVPPRLRGRHERE